MARQDLLARTVQTALHGAIEATRPLMRDFVETAKAVESRTANAADVKDNQLWPKARALMALPAQHGIRYDQWPTIVNSLFLEFKADSIKTAKTYKSTITRAPFAVTTPEAKEYRKRNNLPEEVNLAEVGFTDLRKTMAGADAVFKEETSPDAVKYAATVKRITEALTKLPKDQRKTDTKPALVGMAFKDAQDVLEAILGLIPERAEAVASDADDAGEPASNDAELPVAQPARRVANG